MHVEPDDLALIAFGDDNPAAADHLASCPECSREVRELRETLEAVRRDGPVEPMPVPEGLWEKIAAEAFGHQSEEASTAAADDPPTGDTGTDVTESDDSDGHVVPMRGRQRRRRSPLFLLVAAAAGLAVGVAGTMYVLDRSPQESAVASADLEALDTSLPAAGAQIVERDGQQVLIVQTDELADADGGFLEVWLLNQDVTGLVTLGPLDSARQEFVLPAALDLGEFPIVDISREPLDGDPTHSGDSLWRGELHDTQD